MPQISRTPLENGLTIRLVDSISNTVHQDILEKLEFKAAYKQTAVLPESGLVYVGLDLKPKTKSTDPYFKVNYYELGAAAVNAIAKTGFADLNVADFPGTGAELRLFLLGMYQASWKFNKYLKQEKPSLIERLNIGLDSATKEKWTEESERYLNAMHDALLLTRSVIEDIPDYINPQSMPEIIEKELGNYQHVSITRLDAKELEQKGMNGILAVGRGSRFEPVLMHTVLKPSGDVRKRVCLVGKGLTFDSGGYNIKPDGGLGMKTDMGGSATMLGVMKALTKLQPEHVEVHWISSFVENLIDGSAYKPDDILTSFSGQTIEIWNTDAEGRLTLADGLSYATLQDPDYIVDAATLTGAAIVAVSDYYTALMGNDEELIHNLLEVFEQEQERTVHTRMPEVLREAVKGKLSDLVNTSTIGRNAGHITAGLFLSHFVDQNLFRNSELQIDKPKAYPWVHLDIAGSSHNAKHNALETDGATGQSVRSLVSWIRSLDLA